jgi:hypothetical protein
VSYAQGLTKKVREVEKKLDEVQKEVKDNTKAIEKVDKNVEDLRKELDEIKNSKDNGAAGMMTSEEYREREARRLNIIMHRVKESAAATAELRREADMMECNNIFKAAGVTEQDRDIKTCRRIGEKSKVSNEPRPVVVVMKREASRTAILEAARQLRNTSYKEVSIIPDLTPMQRKEEAGLTDEAARRNKDELTTEDRQKNLRWQVVGQRGARRLIKMTARTENGWRDRMRGTSSQGPSVPQPNGRAPTLPGPELLPSRKRNREWRAAAHSREGAGEEVVMSGDEEDEDETRSPASKK